MKTRYLDLTFLTLEKGWHPKWFYLSDPIGSLPAYSPDRMGPVMPLSWKSLPEGLTLEVAEGLLGRTTMLKDARLTGRAVVREFFFRQVLPLAARLASMWEYIGLVDTSSVAEG